MAAALSRRRLHLHALVYYHSQPVTWELLGAAIFLSPFLGGLGLFILPWQTALSISVSGTVTCLSLGLLSGAVDTIRYVRAVRRPRGTIERLTIQLTNFLNQWDRGRATEADTQELANYVAGLRTWPKFADYEPWSIQIEILHRLANMDRDWVLHEDIPALKAFLESQNPEKAWREYRAYWHTIDRTARADQLQDHPFYVTA